METLNQARNCHKSWYWHTLPKSNYKPMQFGIFASSCLRNTAAQQTPFLLVQLVPVSLVLNANQSRRRGIPVYTSHH
jgi:hypothetical protein